MHIKTNVDIQKEVDLVHYKEAWKQGVLQMYHNNLPNILSNHGVLVSPGECSLDELINTNEKFRQYYRNIEPNTVAFVKDMNTFYADSFMTYIKIVTVHKWIHSLKQLNSSPVKDTIHYDNEVYTVLWTWLFKHNIRFLRV